MTDLYERDFLGWTETQADALRRRSPNELDWDNLLEEIEALGKSIENELYSRFAVLLAHLLKWSFQPTNRSRSWVLTIEEQRHRIDRLLRQNPSLKSRRSDVLKEAYRSGLRSAAEETGLKLKTFPSESPFDFETAMTEEVVWPYEDA